MSYLVANVSVKFAEAAKRRLAGKLARKAGLVAVGIREPEQGEFEIVVFVRAPTSPVRQHVPEVWDGFPVRTVISGRARST